MNNFILAPKTFIGRRSNNQDNCYAKLIKDGVCFLAVADGMGGTIGGQIASELILDTAIRIILEEYKWEVKPNEMKGILERVFLSSQKAISQRIKGDPSLAGMGTTLTCVLIQDDKYVWGNIGDSRSYLLRNNNLKQISIDHTYIQDFLNESGGKTLPQNIMQGYSNYLLRALDGGTDQADIFPQDKDFEKLVDGDIFLLCSDGLIIDKLHNDTTIFKEYILGSKNLHVAAEQLISLAFHNGSKDNITAVLASVGNYKRIKNKNKKFVYPPIDTVNIELMNRKKSPKSNKIIGGTALIVTILLVYLIAVNPYQKEIIEKIFFSDKEKDMIKSQYEEHEKTDSAKQMHERSSHNQSFTDSKLEKNLVENNHQTAEKQVVRNSSIEQRGNNKQNSEGTNVKAAITQQNKTSNKKNDEPDVLSKSDTHNDSLAPQKQNKIIEASKFINKELYLNQKPSRKFNTTTFSDTIEIADSLKKKLINESKNSNKSNAKRHKKH